MTKSVAEIFAAGGAPAVDLALTAVEAIPGFSTAVGLLNILDDFRSRLMVAKMQSFIDGTKSATAEDIAKIEERLDAKDGGNAIGETLILAIDSFTTLDKCEVLGVLYVAFLKNKLTEQQLRRLTHSIDSAFSDDLREFLLYPFAAPWESEKDPDFYVHLERSGLTKVNDSSVVRGGLKEPLRIEVTELGKLFREAYWTVRPVSKPIVPENLAHIFKG